MLVIVGCAVLLPAMGPCYLVTIAEASHTFPYPIGKKSSLLKSVYICKHKTENSWVRNQITTTDELKVKETRPLELAPNPKVSDLLIQ